MDGGRVVGEWRIVGDCKVVVRKGGVCSVGNGSIAASFKGSMGEIDWKEDFDKD